MRFHIDLVSAYLFCVRACVCVCARNHHSSNSHSFLYRPLHFDLTTQLHQWPCVDFALRLTSFSNH